MFQLFDPEEMACPLAQQMMEVADSSQPKSVGQETATADIGVQVISKPEVS